MKRLRIMILMVLLAMAGSTYAIDELTVGNIIMKPDESATLSVGLTNETTMIAFEFYMRLPDGISIVKDEDGDYVVMSSTRLNKHELSVAQDDDGRYHFLCHSNKNKTISGNDGELLSIELTCAEGVAEGTYQAMLEDIVFSDPAFVQVEMPSSYSFGIIVSSTMLGDVNMDDQVDVADVTAQVNIMNGNAGCGQYDTQAADMDGNGSVETDDVRALVRLILEKP